MGRLKLLPLELIVKTGDVDHADWNYKPLLGKIQRVRFRMIKQLLNNSRGERLLEIGYGSGVFMPELARHADELYGVDIHEMHETVKSKLSKFGTDAELTSKGAEKLNWENNYFDFVVAVSAVAFVDDLDAVCREVSRTLKPRGSFLVVTPGKSPLLDLGLKVMTGEDADADFADRRERILPTLYRHFDVKKELKFPRYGSFAIKLYTALDLQPKKS